MNPVFKIVNSAALTLGVGLSLAQASQAQSITIASIQGGSSALQGDYRAGSNFRSGAIPNVIAVTPSGITNYKDQFTSDNFFVAANVQVTDGSRFSENVTDAMIRYNEIAPGDIRVIVLLRSDSGFGVRYVANRAYIQSWSTFSTATGAALTDPNAIAVRNYLVGNQGNPGVESIDTGLSDVTADSVVRYANFGSSIDVGGLGGIVSRRLSVITLLDLYNLRRASSGPVNFTRLDVQNLISGAGSTYGIDLIPTVPGLPVGQFGLTTYYRESTSGTRITQVLDSQTVFPPQVVSPSGFLSLSLYTEAGGRRVNGTGAMLTAVNRDRSSYGYSFVTGSAGNSRPNIRVSSYQPFGAAAGALPYDKTPGSAGLDLSLPNNNGQAPYNDDPYYTGVLNGTYTKWTYANSFSVPSGNATSDSIRDALQFFPNFVHREGLLTVQELNDAGIDRTSFTSDITGEQVTDGQRVVSFPGGNSAFPGDPQP